MSNESMVSSKEGKPKQISAGAQSLDSIINSVEKDLYYRNRLPDSQTPANHQDPSEVSLFDWDFSSIVSSASDGSFGSVGMPAKFSCFYHVPTKFKGAQVAIIGAGAAGLAAGYELMKLGLKPVFYEMQTQMSPKNEKCARPYGRILSWDWGGNGITTGAAAGWYPDTDLTPETLKPKLGVNVPHYGRRVAELGGMRFPATHLTLRTYTDSFFRKDYYYDSAGTKPRTTPWVPFRDPGLYHATGAADPARGGVIVPTSNDTLTFDTVYNTKGIFKNRASSNPPTRGGYSETDRVFAGTTLKESNQAVQNLTAKYFDLLFGELDPTNKFIGILTPMLTNYSAYAKESGPITRNAVVAEWQRLINVYDSTSLGEMLTEAGWDDESAYLDWGDMNISLSEMFGEIGTGTGPFAMFYYSSVMELLRIALQAADSAQDYFVGGAGYQLQPFLTHFTKAHGGGVTDTNLFNETLNQVITDKVVSVTKGTNGGVTIKTANGSSNEFVAAIVTSSPSAIRASNLFPDPGGFIPSRAVSYFKRIRINNNSKIAVNFPNLMSNGEPVVPSQAFWMNRHNEQDNNANSDSIVTTLTDKTIRQVYTFDNYHWGTVSNFGKESPVGPLSKSGTLMLNYGWDYNAQSWTADDMESAVWESWSQVKDIYRETCPDIDSYDANITWALANDQAAMIVWEKIDGFDGAWRMAQPGRGTNYGNDDAGQPPHFSEFETAQTFGMSSFNPETDAYTGLFIAGEATASPGLSGWVEGSIQTGLQAVGGIVKYLNHPATATQPMQKLPAGVSFALHSHPGMMPLTSSDE